MSGSGRWWPRRPEAHTLQHPRQELPIDLESRLQAVVGDTYRILKELGGGGMSRVFLAQEARLSRQVVIKSSHRRRAPE